MLDVFVVNVAFTKIGESYRGSSLADVSWVLNGYAIVYAALLIPAGRFSDRFGRKAGFLSGLGLFTAASVACAAAPTLWALVAFRLLQAVG
ncbi:MFS transporter, partial [Nocardia nova]